MENLVFLTYISRSGSTYLAKLLDEYEDIGVSIEASFPDGIIKRPIIIKNESYIDNAVKKLYKDIKFKAWKISRENLIAAIKRNSNYPITFNMLLPILLKLYFEKTKPNAKIYIYKSPYTGYIREVKKLFSRSKFIFLIRDGRAVYNSQKKSNTSYTGKPMADNPIMTANEYNRALGEAIKYENESWVHIIKYEDLINQKSVKIESLLKFLKTNSKKPGFSNYFERIPNVQKCLHKNIRSSPIANRINAWEIELGIEERFVFQRSCFKALNYFNYSIERVDFGKAKQTFIYCKFYLNYIFRRFSDKFRAYLNFNYLLDRIWYRLLKSKYRDFD